MTILSEKTLVYICNVQDLQPERGQAALVNGHQVAIFRLFDDSVVAVDQFDPYSEANVMSRGIVGTRGGVPTIASPIYKHIFSLETGEVLETNGADPLNLKVWPVQVIDDQIYVEG